MKKQAKREAGRERPASKALPDSPPSRRSRHTSARIPRFPLGMAKKKQGLSPVSPRSALRLAIESPWFRVLAILCVGAAAHGGCLHSTFYLDDWWQIHDSEYVEGGRWWSDPGLLFTHLSYYLTWKVAGFSTVAFHLGNLALHLLLAVSIYWLARYLLTNRTGEGMANSDTVAWLAALIFVAHPLTSEITNYARARDHGFVALFSFLAAGFTALAARRNWRWALAALAAILCATFSKGPGLPHAALNVGFVALAFGAWHAWPARLSRRSSMLTAIGAAALALLLMWPVITTLGSVFVAQVGTRQFALHALTQSRVLPQYLWRMLLPLNLCSDHLIAATKNFADLEAWICAAGALVLVTGCVFLWIKRQQPWALLLTLALAPLLLRWLYNITELMVEYRAYPAMPFVAILLAIPLCRWGNRQPRAATAAAGLMLAFFIALSHQRSQDWRTPETLYAQIQRIYPLQLRVLNCRSADDLRQENFEAVLTRHAEFNQRLEEALKFSRGSPNRGYENWIAWLVAEQCMYTDALAQARSPALARQSLDVTERGMNQLHVETRSLWAGWHLTAAHIDLLEDQKDSAVRHFLAARPFWRKLPIDREIQKIDPTYSSDILPRR